jgi:uncharacterized membrane protein
VSAVGVPARAGDDPRMLWFLVSLVVVIIAVISLFDLIRYRDRHGTSGIVGWAVLIVILPFVGSIAYWAMRDTSTQEVEDQRLAEESLRQEAERGRFDSTAFRR